MTSCEVLSKYRWKSLKIAPGRAVNPFKNKFLMARFSGLKTWGKQNQRGSLYVLTFVDKDKENLVMKMLIKYHFKCSFFHFKNILWKSLLDFYFNYVSFAKNET